MENTSRKALQQWSAVDLFCGVGGLTHGFVLEGFNIIAGIDSDAVCKFAYEYNNDSRFINRKIEDITSQEIIELYPKSSNRILIGCAPCQPFSQYKKKKGTEDEKWKLLAAFADHIDLIRPQVVTMENVPELLKFRGGEVFNDFVTRLSTAYNITSYIVSCSNYGIPQKRTRLVLLASRLGSIELEGETFGARGYRTVRDAIGHLPRLEAGQVSTEDPLHRAAGLSETNLRRIRQSNPGGTWRDWEDSLVADCHKKASGQSYDSVYGRMSWDKPSPTITAQCNGYGNGRFGHPEQDRAISMREAALLQTFPSSYQFLSPDSKWHIETLARLIGNAVPVELARVIARSVKRHIEDYCG